MAFPLFDVRDGERPRVARAGFALFAILAAHTISETARDAILLGSSGTSKRLATAYVALAVVAMGALAINTSLIRHLGRRYAMIATLMGAAFGHALFFIVHPTPAVAFVLYLWTGLLGTLVVVQYWLLAATVFTSTEAKRLYGLVAAIGALGSLVGALAAAVLVTFLTVQHLLPLGAALYLVAGLVLSTDDAPAAATQPTDTSDLLAPRTPKKIRWRDHPYAVRIALLVIFATAAALVADYLLKTSASHAARDRGLDLGSFFARYNGVVSGVSLLFQVFGASWLLRKTGVLGSILMLPLLMLGGGIVTILTTGAFLAAVATKGADATLRHSVNRVANELLWMPVAEDVRSAVRGPLESVVARLVQAATALLLLGISTLGYGGPVVYAGLVVGFAGAWVIVAGGMRPAYLKQLRTSLSRPTFAPEHELDLGSLEIVVEALSSTDDRRVIAAIQVLAAHQRGRLIPALVLRHDSPDVLAVALDAIAHKGRTDWVALTTRLLQAPDPHIRIAAVRALARAGMSDAIQTGLADADPSVRAAAMFWQQHTGARAVLAEDPTIAALLAATGEDAVAARRHLLDAIRKDGDKRWVDVLAQLARVGDASTIENVALAIERVPDPRFVPILIGRLSTRAGRSSVRAALVAIGPAALAALADALRSLKTAPRMRLHIPTTIAMFGSREAGDILLGQLAQERSGDVRYRLLRALARLAVTGNQRFEADLLLDELRHHLREHFRLLGLAVPLEAELEREGTDSARMLLGLLRDKASQAHDRVFLVVQALHPREDIRGIERALVGHERSARAHANEFLDTLTRAPVYLREHAAGIREDLLLVGEELPARERVLRAGEASDIPETATEAMERLVNDIDTLLAACAAYHALQLNRAELTKIVNTAARARPVLAPLGIVHAGFYGG